MGNDDPKVTVIMPVYNAAKYLPAALDSVLAQTLQDFEIVAVNDGSTDDSGAILEQYAARDSRIRFVTQKNAGCAAARNAAVARAKGRYLAMHDADDVSYRTRLEKQAALLDARPGLSAVYCCTVVADKNLKPLAAMRMAGDPRTLRRNVRRRNALQQNCMVRKQVFDRIGGYRDAILFVEDFDFNLRLLEAGDILCVPEAYHIYRQHSAQMSRTGKAKMPMFGALTRTFALERKLRGRDSYTEFSKIRDIEKFMRDYEFRNYFYFFAGRSALRHLLLPQARAYIKRAWKEGYRTFGAALLYAKALLPFTLLKAVSYFYSRFVARKWSRKMPRYITEMLSPENINAHYKVAPDK